MYLHTFSFYGCYLNFLGKSKVAHALQFNQNPCTTECTQGLPKTISKCPITCIVNITKDNFKTCSFRFSIKKKGNVMDEKVFPLELPTDCDNYRNNSEKMCSRQGAETFNISMFLKTGPEYEGADIKCNLIFNNVETVYSNSSKIVGIPDQTNVTGYLTVNEQHVLLDNCNITIRGEKLDLHFKCISSGIPCAIRIEKNDEPNVLNVTNNFIYNTTLKKVLIANFKFAACSLNENSSSVNCTISPEHMEANTKPIIIAAVVCPIAAILIIILLDVIIFTKNRKSTSDAVPRGRNLTAIDNGARMQTENEMSSHPSFSGDVTFSASEGGQAFIPPSSKSNYTFSENDNQLDTGKQELIYSEPSNPPILTKLDPSYDQNLSVMENGNRLSLETTSQFSICNEDTVSATGGRPPFMPSSSKRNNKFSKNDSQIYIGKQELIYPEPSNRPQRMNLHSSDAKMIEKGNIITIPTNVEKQASTSGTELTSVNIPRRSSKRFAHANTLQGDKNATLEFQDKLEKTGQPKSSYTIDKKNRDFKDETKRIQINVENVSDKHREILKKIAADIFDIYVISKLKKGKLEIDQHFIISIGAKFYDHLTRIFEKQTLIPEGDESSEGNDTTLIQMANVYMRPLLKHEWKSKQEAIAYLYQSGTTFNGHLIHLLQEKLNQAVEIIQSESIPLFLNSTETFDNIKKYANDSLKLDYVAKTKEDKEDQTENKFLTENQCAVLKKVAVHFLGYSLSCKLETGTLVLDDTFIANIGAFFNEFLTLTIKENMSFKDILEKLPARFDWVIKRDLECLSLIVEEYLKQTNFASPEDESMSFYESGVLLSENINALIEKISKKIVVTSSSCSNFKS